MHRLKFIFWESDLLAARLMLALGSIAWTILLLIRHFSDGPDVSSIYILLAGVIDLRLLALTFGIHAVMATYSICQGFKRRIFMEMYSVLGLFVWSTTTVFIVISVGGLFTVFPASVVPNLLLAFIAWWYSIRVIYKK